MRPRDLDRLASGTYDVLVVGGGIHGLAAAYEAASRGLAVALVEAGDFGSGASFNHQKTVHGGLRSLQSGRVDRALQAIKERRALARIAPWVLRPLPFLIGTYRSVLRNRVVLRAGFKFDEWLGRKRNVDVEPELHLPAPRLVSKAATLRLFPGIRQEGLTGGAQWYDYQMVEADRLTLAFAAAADAAGANIANYVEALEPIREGARIAGMTVRDQLTGQTLTIKASATVNVAGSHAGVLMNRFGVKRDLPLLKAMNLLTSRRASDMALAAPTAAGRMLTLVPWQGHALIGTSQSASMVRPDDVSVTAAEVQAFVAEANEAFPALGLGPDEVTLVHRGVVPAVPVRNGAPALLQAPAVYDHASEGASGAFTVVGVKYTTARAVAERVTNLVANRLGKRVRPSRSATTVLPGAGIADHEALAIETARRFSLELPLTTIRHLIGRYAESGAEIVRLFGERPDLLAPLSPEVQTRRAEIVHVIRREMAVRLSDIVIRRTGLGVQGRPPDDAIRASAVIAAAECGWDAQRTADEIRRVQDFYSIATGS
jgi:glycerol-3-phosphate dehydrogenase